MRGTSENPNGHRGALRGTPGSVCPQPEPNATELPSCAPISARAAQRRRRRRWWRGEEGARRPGPEGQVCATSCGTSSTAPCAASFTCSSFMCHLRAGVGGTLFCPLHVSTVSTATATGPAAPTMGFGRSKSAWRDDKETVDEGTLGGAWGWEAVGGRPRARRFKMARATTGLHVLNHAFILRGACVPPLEDDACHDEHLYQ